MLITILTILIVPVATNTVANLCKIDIHTKQGE